MMMPVVQWRRILCEIAVKHRVSVAAITGPDLSRPVVRARQEAMWRMRQETRLSLPQIGGKFGRHHATVIFAIRRHQATLDMKDRAA